MIELPMRAFCLDGVNGSDKIEMTIDHVFDFPEQTSFRGGYDLFGDIIIRAGGYTVHSSNITSSTGRLHDFLVSLTHCYNLLSGVARFESCPYERNLELTLTMVDLGHTVIDGYFRENFMFPNDLIFGFHTDQTYILRAISDLKQVEKLFDDNKGKQI